MELYEQQLKDGSNTMSLAQAIRSRREARRSRRELERAISNAATPALRDELIIISQREFIQHTR